MAFVEPTRDASLSLSLTHSMLHQTFLSSSLFSFHPSSSATTPFLSRSSLSSSSKPQAEREAGMEAALRRTAVGAEALWGHQQQQQQQQSGFSGDDVVWAGEQSCSLLGDEFSVDDLLDFGELMETEEKRRGEDGDEEDEEELDCEEEEAGGRNSNSPSALSYEPPPPTEIDVPADDVAELEWVSRFVDDSYSEYPSCAAVPPPPKPETRLEAKTEDNRQGHAFGIPAAPAEAATCAFYLVPVKAKRSKRPRSAGAAWSSRGSAPFIDLSTSPSSSCSSSSSAPAACLVYDYYAGVGNPDLLPLEADPLAPPEEEPSQKKKRGRKPKLHQPPLPTPTLYAAVSSGGGERRCSHCGVQKTPQWRAGPLGPKTLCNACGVRYKSGRLLPEYRPACSPTFVSHVHSNSHRRVLEMRRKKEEHRLAVVAGAGARSSPEPALVEPVQFGSVGSGSSV